MDILDLGGAWTVQKQGRGARIAASVPGDVYADLLRAKKIPDPFYRDNEESLQWIGETDWRYSRAFDVSAALLAHERVLLHCDGLDTFATVRINGTEVGRGDNMFRTWEWDVRSALRAGRNRIEIDFASTIPYIEQNEKNRPIPFWGKARTRDKVANHGWVRKEPCNYGWDWGLKAVTCGIWRSIRLVAFDQARLSDVRIAQDHRRAGEVTLTVHASAESVREAPLSVLAVLRRDGAVVTQACLALNAGSGCVDLVVEKPALWWPNGMGEQPLYDVAVTLCDAAGAPLDETTRRIGLRTLRLDRHPDAWGESFQFVVNGIPFFAKGANWIPADGILARMTPERYRALVADAAAANMNMLRAWGGGIYEDDAFFAACDELGVCVWQDFMFACSTVPAFDEAFLASVAAEARDNVRRLRHHPSIALWCGNNELEQGLVGPAWSQHQMSWQDYGKLFDRLLPDVIRACDPERDYWPCSPHSPRGERTDFNNPTCGDAHLWSVWHGRQPFEWYRTCEHRFNSEFGFQSFPEPKTVLGYTEPGDRNVTSRIMEHHQRSGIGNTTIMQYMLDWFRLPVGFENTLWASQILQGMAIKYACEHWRRSMPRGMGTLYWQINDTWPVASWSSIDYHGRWKALHYMARNFFAPLLVSGLDNWEKGTLEIHVTSDRMAAARGAVRWTVTDAAGKRLAAGSRPAEVAPRTDQLVHTLQLDKTIAKHGAHNVIVWLELLEGRTVVSTNLALFARPKHIDLSAKPGIKAAVAARPDGAFDVTLTTARPALWCWLELEGLDARFNDNFVHLRPGAPVVVRLQPARRLTLAQARARLVVRSLVDTYA